jgi:alpha-tubulin suppressor-like RCC1 family protein
MNKKLLLSLIIFSFVSSALAQCQKAFSLGWTHSVSIKEDGTLWSWGANGNGQLGIGSTTNKNTPVQVGNALWKEISAAEDHTIAIKQDGTLWSWGSNFQGVLGNGTMYDGSNVPVQIGTASGWAKVSSGPFHNLAIKDDGTLWAWGYNGFNNLGDGTNVNRLTPVQIGTANDWVQVAAGYVFSMALKADGTRWAWGGNYEGMLGDGTTDSKSVPTQIGTDTWEIVAAGDYNGVGIKTDGTLWSWGSNSYNQVGDGTTTHRTLPVQIMAQDSWKHVAARNHYIMVIKDDGTLWTWGQNYDFVNSLSPVQMGTASNWSKTYAGGNHYVGIDNAENYLMWGFNNNGQLGNGTNTQNNTPSIAGCTTLSVTPQISESGLVTAYPNPASHILTVENAKVILVKAEVYDVSGKLLVTSSQQGDRSLKLDISKLENAVYLVKVTSMTGTSSVRFVKQ